MTLISPVEPGDQDGVKTRQKYRTSEELRIRDALEAWGRTRWPDRRIVHELVMDRGRVRADMAFIGTDTFDVIEIKSSYDDSSRLMMQSAFFALAAPHVWLCVAPAHEHDAHQVRYLLPHIGLIRALTERFGAVPQLETIEEAKLRQPLPESMLSLLWVAELRSEAERGHLLKPSSKPPTHAHLVKLLQRLSPEEQIAAVCRQLRGRDALWRADPPIRSVERVSARGEAGAGQRFK